MLTLLGGRQRTTQEYEELLADAGFVLEREIDTRTAGSSAGGADHHGENIGTTDSHALFVELDPCSLGVSAAWSHNQHYRALCG
ncbi:MAG: hypothetical protein M3350_06555, partial [Actinomycetota bacterium]|nr:hypothetical protein [Actinomycetota bacterium]